MPARNAGGSHTALSAASDEVAAAPPVIETPPSIGGTARDGATLTADPGRWGGTDPVAFGYRGERCDATAAECDPIDGADGKTHGLTGADVGHALRAVITARNDDGTATALAGPTGVVAAVAPDATAAPGIDGAARDGATLTASRGAWTGTDPIDFAYQWRRCDAAGSGCTDIAGATERTVRGDRRRRRARAAGRRDSEQRRRREPRRRSRRRAWRRSRRPSAAPRPSAGPRATAGRSPPTPARWDGTQPMAFACQWQRCDADGCSDIAGASGSTYTPTATDVVHPLRVAVTATNAGGTATAASERSATVGGAAPANQTPPSIDGVGRDGRTLTADPGRWGGTAPVAFAYQWQRCDPPARAASRSTAPTARATRRLSATSTTRSASSSPRTTTAARRPRRRPRRLRSAHSRPRTPRPRRSAARRATAAR